MPEYMVNESWQSSGGEYALRHNSWFSVLPYSSRWQLRMPKRE
jgi:hypothetical protein